MNLSHKSLLDLMQITDVEIRQRMELLDINGEHLALLAGNRNIIESHIDSIVDRFYEIQTAIDDVSILIGDADTLQRLRKAQTRYILDLFTGSYGSEYVNNRLRIGQVHRRIGVEPKLYLAAVKTLKDLLCQVLAAAITTPAELSRVIDSLDRLLFFDTTLIFDTYIDSLVRDVRTAQQKTEDYARELEVKVAERTRELEALAQIDPLTGAFNQRAMRDLFRREMINAKRRQTPISIGYFDVDNFKHINDRHGHIKGDEVLKHISSCLQQSIRETDIHCRYGGDEFCVILTDCGAEMAVSVCTKIIAAFTEKFPDFALSCGIASTGPEEFQDEEELIELSDKNMYLAKKQPGSCIHA